MTEGVSGFTDPDSPAAIPGDELRRRAAAASFLLGARGALMLGLSLVGNLVLARLLLPGDFGLVALGNVLVLAGTIASDGGLAAGLIARPVEPSRRDLEAALGFHLAVSLVLMAAIAAGASGFGRDGKVVALMALSLPLAVLRIPPAVECERALSYGAVATAEVLEAVSYFALAIAGVIAGFGVWALAAAVVLRSAIGSVAMIRLAARGAVRPRWAWATVRPLLGFGVRFQAASVVTAAREQSISVGIAATSGLPALGLWTLASRLLQPAVVLLGSVGRVTFPAMARLSDTGRNPRSAIEQTAAVVSVLTAVALVALVGSAQVLVSLVVGEAWRGAAPVLLWSALGLMIGTPLTVAASGYFLAVGKAGIVLRCAIAKSIAWLAVGFALVGSLGPIAFGLGWTASGIVTLAIYLAALRQHTTVRAGRIISAPLLGAVTAGGLAWLVASSGAPSVRLGALAVIVGELVLVGMLALLARDQLVGAIRLLGATTRDVVRLGRKPRAPAAADR